MKTKIAETKKDKERWVHKAETHEKQLHEYQSELQSFKLFEALGESYPQSILQFTIMLKKGLANFEPDIIPVLSLVTSLTTILVTMSG